MIQLLWDGGGDVPAAARCAAAPLCTVTTELESIAATTSPLRMWELDFRHNVTITYEIHWVRGRIPSGPAQATDYQEVSHF